MAWDVPLEETADALSLFVWGCELRLIPGMMTCASNCLRPNRG
ncbi:hypothetical protein ACFSYD_03410 [Paracoccus aerius]